jgi:hypothetical protein
MPQQPELISPSLPASPAQEPGAGQVSTPAPPTAGSATGIGIGADIGPAETAEGKHGPQRIPRWLEQVELFVRVLLLMCLGMFIFCLPWWPALWDFSPLFLRFPVLAHYATLGEVRGLISGLGLLNLWIAFHDAIRHGTEKQ